jgi:CubicO group peptidase (beta-lactamase class C family)
MTPFAWSPSGAVSAILPLRWPAKAAGAMVDVTLDAAAVLASAADTLSAALNLTSNVQTVAPAIVIGGQVVLWLAGGVAGADGLVDLTLSTASGRVVRRIIRVCIY